VVKGPDEAYEAAKALLGMNLVTPQTGPEGREVRALLVEQGLDIEEELYLAVTLDRGRERPVVMFSPAGGMAIEEVAAATPEKIFKEWSDPNIGWHPFRARRIGFGAGLPKEVVNQAAGLIGKLLKVYEATDASLVEINPLVRTKDNKLIALDAKLNLDDSGLFRHPDLAELRDLTEEEPLEVEASKHGVNYIKLDGNIGCMVNGAGLAMATMDIIKLHGGEPANFLDVGGGAKADQIANAFRILISDPNVKAILVNIFGGILRVDRLATGIVEAAKVVDLTVPIVVRLEGTNVEEGRRILQESGLTFQVADTMEEGARLAVEAAGGGN
jgi:succinyl-CoA synthetase beta subunit